MTVNTQTVLLSLISGAVLGGIAVVFYFLGKINEEKRFCLFLQDTTFVVISFMVTFLVSFPVSNGRIRFLQVLLEVPGFLLVWMILSPAGKKLAGAYILMRNKIRTFIAKIRPVSSQKPKKSRKNSKKPKKTLAVPPSGNI